MQTRLGCTGLGESNSDIGREGQNLTILWKSFVHGPSAVGVAPTYNRGGLGSWDSEVWRRCNTGVPELALDLK